MSAIKEHYHDEIEKGTRETLSDGAYRVVTNYMCAGFSVRNGEIVNCAPILRLHMDYYKTIAKKI